MPTFRSPWYNGSMDTMVSIVLTYDDEIDQWGAWLSGISAYGQGGSPQEAIEDLKRALGLYIEEVGREKFLQDIDPPSQVLSLPLSDLVPLT